MSNEKSSEKDSFLSKSFLGISEVCGEITFYFWVSILIGYPLGFLYFIFTDNIYIKYLCIAGAFLVFLALITLFYIFFLKLLRKNTPSYLNSLFSVILKLSAIFGAIIAIVSVFEIVHFLKSIINLTD